MEWNTHGKENHKRKKSLCPSITLIMPFDHFEHKQKSGQRSTHIKTFLGREKIFVQKN